MLCFYIMRNLDIEKRIKERKDNDYKLGINSYGGMGLDGISGNYKNMILEEMNYIKNHPEIYNKKRTSYDSSVYLIKLK